MKNLAEDVNRLSPERHDYLRDKVDYCSEGWSAGFSCSMEASVPGPVDYETLVENDLGTNGSRPG